MKLNKNILIFGTLTILAFSSFAIFYGFNSSGKEIIKSGENKKTTTISANIKKKASIPIIDPENDIPYSPITFDTLGKWVVKGPKPLANSILPTNRIVAFYGNLYSKKMGVLGEYPGAEMLNRLDTEIKKWQLADPKTPVKPALHLIVVTAQGQPGKNNTYNLRMPYKLIDSTLSLAKKRNAIVFLDIQVGHSTLQQEIPLLEKYLKLPNVHLGIDPEFSMKSGDVPGKRIGTFDAADVNYAINYLQNLVKSDSIPPKLLIVHRFTRKMVTNSKDIKLKREVQVVMHMDGWGPSDLKKDTYKQYIYKEPVQYTGFKLFFKNDIKCGKPMMEPKDVLALYPQPLYIQYQ
ncbi:hypothetical protein [Solitalea koreensis]|uniref:Lipoprotein n=1 Tax=Solitalea koreensis TaxID=543615 RepID=A0A521ACB5_9SPHI|nr:hypothetical protein [Solitalea koreensis]SMO32467.1 hypothetical protein SAMN06265350_10151 [Solitalea koreensis]